MTVEVNGNGEVKRRPMCYGYLRMSTNKQIDSPEIQREIIIEQARRDGLTIDVWITDPAISAGVPLYERPGGRELGNVLRKGDRVYISKLDRAFRRAADCAVVTDKWQRIGVHLCICNLLGLAIDLSSPIGKFIVLILAAVAELEREFIRERTRDALAGKARKNQARGKYAGYGFTWRKVYSKEEGRYVKVKVANPEERAVMKEIVRWRLDGHSFDTIRQHVVYTLKLKTPDGTDWSVDRIMRAFNAELKLQHRENGGK